MFRKMYYGGLLLLAGVVLLMTPGYSWAQHGHFGGGHFGGAHFGGAPFAAARVGGYHGGLYHGGYHYRYGHYHPYYGYHHGYGLYPYYGYGYGAYSDLLSGLATDPGYGSDYAEAAPTNLDETASVTPPAAGYQYYYAPVTSTAQPDAVAHITVDVPADAKVWFDGALMTSTGPVRQYNSPLLTPGNRYAYDVKASWNEKGHEVTQTQKVEVAAGAHVNVDFPAPPKGTAQASADPHS
jgi:uncharacterized protein (TIGR03000 family)